MTYYSREGYSPLKFVSQYSEPSRQLWIDMYFKAIHVMAQTYLKQETKPALQCFYQSLSDILPSKSVRMIMQDFITMTDSVKNFLLADTGCFKSFFLVHKELRDYLQTYPADFFDHCFQNSETLFLWTYLLHNYYNVLNRLPCLNLNAMRHEYQRKNIGKETWANPLWFILHFSACYGPSMLDETWGTAYKALVSCFQIILPCEICRAHWVENLPRFPIDNYLFTCNSVFEWSWLIHNEVNKSLNKACPSLDEARRMYKVDESPRMQQNMYYRFMPQRYA